MATTEPAAGTSPRALHAATLCEAFQITVSERPDQVALRTVGGGAEVTFAEYAARVERIAAGLSTLGVGRGDTVAMMLVNRPEFHLVDAAAFHLGATPFSVYNTSSPEQIAYLFSNAEPRVVVCERQFAGAIPDASQVVLVEELDELEGEPGFDFEAAWRAVTPDDVLTLIYTSGTTGPPKGVELTHANMMAECRGCAAVIPMEVGGRTTSYLPSAHVADRWASHYYGSIVHGATITCVPDMRQVVAALPEVRPTTWGAVPRVWEKIKAALEAKGIADPAALSEEARAGVRASLGLDEAAWLVSGAAPTPTEVLEYFDALGLPICELWGMSELSCCATINPPEDIRIGTVGKALPGVELRLLEDGELLVRGGIVMRGYRRDPERTADAVDADGWLHTGDVAEIDSEGYVRIVDRKKELIINAAGKNMSPANIEQRLKASSPLIDQAIAFGDRRPYNVALIVLDPDLRAVWPEAEIEAEVARGIEEANGHLSRVEQIKRFAILPVDWEPGGDELTPTMKLKRRPIAAKYAAEIEALYSA